MTFREVVIERAVVGSARLFPGAASHLKLGMTR